MSQHSARIEWTFGEGDFAKGRYSREHGWTFDGGLTVAASASPAVVPAPFSNPAHIDPEEAYVASLASCHMLTFLHAAWRAGVVVHSYTDDAVGVMSKGENGVPWISSVTLNPRIVYAPDKAPSAEQEKQLHDAAHHGCFIANSVKTAITVATGAAERP